MLGKEASVIIQSKLEEVKRDATYVKDQIDSIEQQLKQLSYFRGRLTALTEAEQALESLIN